MLRIGVDVGGTNTDGVLIDVTKVSEPNRGVLAHFKAPTTPNVSDGIEKAIGQLLERAHVSPSEVSSVSIGTTAFINAVLEQDSRRLSKVAIIRLCGPYTRQCPPFIDFPPELKVLMDGHVGYVDGGLEIDGREIVPMKESQIVEQCRLIKTKNLKNVVVAGVFSPLDNDGIQEARAAKIIQQELGPGVNVVCSREVGQVGMLERENASILNASILTFAQRTIRHFRKAIRALNLTCPLFLTQNDGTLTSAAQAARLPIRTFASGPTNSMRGAAFLSRLDEGSDAQQGKPNIVVDVGGTTTDVGVLLPSGFPRQAAAFIEIGGVRTNFSMADVQSIGLGGGSRVKVVATEKGDVVTVGPDSVGHNLTRDGKVFGGDVLTSTDIVVAGGVDGVGVKDRVTGLSTELIQSAKNAIKKLLERIIVKMKTSPEDVTVLLVGGGSIIAPDELDGVGEIIRPPFFSVANAVGAAMAKVAGEIDTIEILQGRNIDDVIEGLKTEAIAKAIQFGANPQTTQIVEVTNLPVQYVTNQATRIIVKAAGELSVTGAQAITNENDSDSDVVDDIQELDKQALQTPTNEDSKAVINIEEYVPLITDNRQWVLSELDLEWIADGCGVLGTGGGGSPYPPFLVARQLLRDGRSIKVSQHTSLDLPWIVHIDAYLVSNERLQGGAEIPASSRELMIYMHMPDYYGAISDEIGGGNGIQPMIIAAELDKPVLDADLMGRAYPNSLPGAYNIENGLWPCAISDGIGNTVILPKASTPHAVETILRTVTTEMGSRSGVSMAPLSRKTCQDYGVVRSVSQAWRIGKAIALCRKKNEISGIPRSILELQNGACLFIGKIVNVTREVRKGFTWGSVTIVPLQADEEEDTRVVESSIRSWSPDDRIRIPFQNENLYVIRESPGRPNEDKIIVTVPDLITVLDSQSGSSIGTQEYRYGLRVTVVALAGNPKWTKTPEGLACGGPTAFGLHDVEFTPIAEYREPASVIEEYANVR
ncbi:hypothetical protein PHLGIDRAFT_22081 [Phlebiopsis gigantea 11061_1 CR5-6]|uniref:Hydantoinase/oxoprolinase n=1 Tax=Phlebiopsis gigantea (strain 11061_1 CR5-6) TaxID=745531 RepID=A0A0C3SCE0_PHLG1|nr:hypothetical protein PHLGIDRAFT_22081 [Phlebiopsis gigantea 11061_1 CR5-6]